MEAKSLSAISQRRRPPWI